MESISQKHPTAAARHRGPSLLLVAIVYVALFLASVVIPMGLANGAHFPSPFDPAAASARYFDEHAAPVRLGAFLQFGSAIPLAESSPQAQRAGCSSSG